jgi:hypothetical protein
MSLITKYLGNTGAISSAKRNANANFNNFAGSGYLPATGAAYQGGMGSMPTSQPYVLLISNSSSSSVANVDVLGASTYLMNPPTNTTWSNGVLTTQSSITITSQTGISYQQLLNQSIINPFVIAYTQVSATNVSAQAFTSFTVTTVDANGRQLVDNYAMIQNLWQQANNGAATFSNFTVDAMTKMTFGTVLGNATFLLYLYPAVNVNPAQALNGKQVINTYGNPNVNGQTIQVIGK